MSVLDHHLYYKWDGDPSPRALTGALRLFIEKGFFREHDVLLLPRLEDRELVIGHHIMQGIPQVIQIVEKIPSRYDERLFFPVP